ncbi:Glycine--tRNA ligase beta subunit [invertebrate metagenome]|uniref:glycine--tRNA ligase n=1 Tax=invertebrate metagenome TaxID=1711999 RepID=A0A2H9T8Y5_9ZZZZ
MRRLDHCQLTYDDFRSYAAPRRLALWVKGLDTRQADQSAERRGPALKAAFDENGNPSKAAMGFARSAGVDVKQLDTLETGKGSWLIYRSVKKGQETASLLPEMVIESLVELPIPKRMRWGSRREEFVRPAHWLVMLQGEHVIDCTILGLKAGNQSFGHRFHANHAITISEPARYEEILLNKGYVMADFTRRRNKIQKQVHTVAQQVGGNAVIDRKLLDEVTGLVEWPVALAGKFDEDFLAVPAESLISSMKEHQKYFHMVDEHENLLPNFITIANIESKDPQQIITGNEKVIRPRLADARFFFDTDRKESQEARRNKLKPIVFQAQLGSVFDKTERVSLLAGWIAKKIGSDPQQAMRAGQLCKSDLASEMVLEFPELQGIMGKYYAQHDGEAEEVSLAQNEQYLPRFAGDRLPSSLTGCAVSLADKIDTITGIFGIGMIPSGSKDPFALRRASIGVLRTLIEKTLDLNLTDLINQALASYRNTGISLPKEHSLPTVAVDYILDRFMAAYQEEGIATEVILSVKALRPTAPLDFDQRIRAINQFSQCDEARALASANKRVSNILAKVDQSTVPDSVNTSLLAEQEEKNLAEALFNKQEETCSMIRSHDYEAIMACLASLKQPVDTFFDKVLVNAEDDAVRMNRYALLQQLRNLFLQVADISLLQKS